MDFVRPEQTQCVILKGMRGEGVGMGAGGFGEEGGGEDM